MITWWEKLLIYIAVAGGLVFLGNEWKGMREANQQLQATIVQIQKGEADRDAALRSQLLPLATAQKTIVTPAQIVKEVPKYLPINLPAPITATQASTPQAPLVITVPQVDEKAYFDSLLQCKQAELQVPVLQADLADEKKKVADLQKAVKGTWKTHVKTAAKWGAIGGGIVLLAIVASGHAK